MIITFWVAAAAFSALTVWFIVRPLVRRRMEAGGPRDALNTAVYRDQARELDIDLENGTITAEQHAAARRELEARVLDDVRDDEVAAPAAKPSRVAGYTLAAIVPIGAFALYLVVGAPATLDPAIMANTQSHAVDQKELAAMVEKLAQRMKAEPENGEGWVMLAKSYKHFGRFDEAAKAYREGLGRLQPDAALLSDYADVLAMAQGRQLQGEPERLVARALELDPKHPKSLALAGTAAFERKDYAKAVEHWNRLLPLVEPGSDNARAIEASIDEARGLGGIAAAAPPAKAAGAPPAPVTSAVASQGDGAMRGAVSGVVKLAPEIAAKVAPTDTVFIYARAAEGSRMPLAIVRKEARELPARFTLDDTSAMSAGATLSKQKNIVIAARVSKNSSATAQPGDFEGLVGPVKNDATGVTVVIDSVVR